VINSRDIAALNPVVADMCHDFISACHEAGIDILITSTYRDFPSQDALYAIGRTVKGANSSLLHPLGSKVTNAKGGQSYHNYRVAFDFVPLIHGKAVWDNLDLFSQCGAIGKSVGLEWAGDWTSFKELAHFQFTDGHSLAELQNGAKIS